MRSAPLAFRQPKEDEWAAAFSSRKSEEGPLEPIWPTQSQRVAVDWGRSHAPSHAMQRTLITGSLSGWFLTGPEVCCLSRRQTDEVRIDAYRNPRAPHNPHYARATAVDGRRFLDKRSCNRLLRD